jgi:hypothetical protein
MLGRPPIRFVFSSAPCDHNSSLTCPSFLSDPIAFFVSIQLLIVMIELCISILAKYIKEYFTKGYFETFYAVFVKIICLFQI